MLAFFAGETTRRWVRKQLRDWSSSKRRKNKKQEAEPLQQRGNTNVEGQNAEKNQDKLEGDSESEDKTKSDDEEGSSEQDKESSDEEVSLNGRKRRSLEETNSKSRKKGSFEFDE